MKTYKQLVAEVAAYVSPADKEFRALHRVKKVSHPVATGVQFKPNVNKDESKLAHPSDATGIETEVEKEKPLEESVREDYHAEANKIIAKHGNGDDIDRDGTPPEYVGGRKNHVHGIKKTKIKDLHKSLTDAGFKNHGETGHVGVSNHFEPGGDKGYHTFSKGKTKVHVASRVNHEDGRHLVEVDTGK